MRIALPLLFAALAVAACRAQAPAAGTATATAEGREQPAEPNAVNRAATTAAAEVVVVAKGLEHPWGLAFLPDGRMLVTERAGRLRIVSADGTVSAPVADGPKVVAQGQGGLLDVVVHPDFANNGLVYLSYSERGGEGAGTSVMRARLEGNTLFDQRLLFQQQPQLPGGNHFGSRLVFDNAGNLFITTGDRMAWPNVQRLDRGQGKVFRVGADGDLPADNPFRDRRENAHPLIWSYGHRNAQGAALHPVTGELWAVEHGARGGDELNIVRAGRNYGWPEITLGVNYSGEKIGTGRTAAPGMEQPIHYWIPSIAPSGMAFYTADRFPAWKGSLFVGALAHQKLVRLTLDGDKVVAEEHLLADRNSRIRDVRQGPDGYVYVLTDDSDGEVLRVGPANP